MVELPGLGKPGATERRPYPPGQHGQRRRKFSEFSLRLMEKQKMIFHYGLREEQLRRFIRKAKSKSSSNWVDTLIGLLESRVDNVVFRLGFAPSIPAARQMVVHGKVLVNGKKLTIPSAVLSPGDKVSLTDKAYSSISYLYASQAPRLLLADFLGKEPGNSGEVGVLKFRPNGDAIPFPFQSSLIAEMY